ncbi:hypothetical protein [Caldimonas tepidiphila]|uniref:hypothetical protein n=1 Tax=Caldimonas tepidiphila TaxID=2315841 RepID=UPI000E5B4E24|nr:hypothetical protein [Caldimonas tepidiphila]
MDDFFAPPPFRADEALQMLRRSLRELRPLAERPGEPVAFELGGQRVVELSVQGDAILARLAKRPARAPEWQTRTLADAAAVRDFTEAVKRALAGWDDDR